MGAVFLALDTRLTRHVAIKILPETTGAEARQRFLREAQAAARLNHPGICGIHAIDEQDGRLFLVLEYIAGKSFRELADYPAEDWPPDPAVAAGYVLQAAEALAAAHASGIIHRDIKGSNLMRTPEGRVKVLDFGLAKFNDSAVITQDGLVVGTPAYLSPEQTRGEALDARTDLWSLGVVFYELLTGRLPFLADNLAALTQAVLYQEPRPVRQIRPEIPSGIARIVEKLLAKDREQRYVSARPLIEDLRPHATGSLSEFFETQIALTPARGDYGSTARLILGMADRRPVTFVTLEVSGTVASEDPEDFEAALAERRALCAKIITAKEGYVSAWTGNTAVAYFGYPRARENAARLAVEGALAVARAFSAADSMFYVRLGVETSLAVAEASESGPAASVSGEGFALSRALLERAAPNEVLIGVETRRSVETQFELGEGGELRLPGGRMLRYVRVLNRSTARTRFEVLPESALTNLEGRRQELQLMLGRWEQAREGQGQVMLLSGAAGIGKSRLVYEVKRRVAEDPKAALIECFCAAQYANTALHPITEFFERFVFEQETRVLPPMAKLRILEALLAELGFHLNETIPLLAQLLNIPAESYSPLESTPERQRILTLEVLTSLLMQRASRQPVLFVVEDLHWADPSTIELLGMVIDQAPAGSLLAVFTYRPEYLPPWQRSHVSAISLNRLSRTDARSLAKAATRGRALESAVFEQIVANSDGVPLFIEEIARTVAEAEGSRADKLPVPESLRDSFLARLDQLGEARNVARMASVLGREFPESLLEALAGLPNSVLRANLNRLVSADILYLRGAGERRSYIFKHALLQEAAYDSLLKKSRAALHGELADILVTSFPEMSASQPEVVAHHFTEAGRGEEAVPYWREAGTAALQRSAYSEAIWHFEKGLEILKALPEEHRNPVQELWLLASLGPALIATRGFGAAEVGDIYGRAEHLLPRAEGSPLKLPTLWGVWVYNLVRSNLDHALRTAERMIAGGEAAADQGMRLEGHWTAGNTLFWKGDLERSRAHLEAAEALYDAERFREHAYRFGQDPLVATLCYQSCVYRQLGMYDRGDAATNRSIGYARSLRHPFSIGWALSFQAVAGYFEDDFDQAQRCGENAMRYCQEQAYPFWISAALGLWGWGLAGQRDAKGGLDHMREALRVMRSIGSRVIEPLFRGLLAEGLLRSGDREGALQEIDGGIEQSRELGVAVSLPDLLRVRGAALWELGRKEESHVALMDALTAARAMNSFNGQIRVAVELVRLFHQREPLLALGRQVARQSHEPAILRRAREFLH